LDSNHSDPVFSHPGKRPAQGVEELLMFAREQLGLGPDRPWQLISSGMKFTKTFFELEESGPEGSRRLIGRVSAREKSKGAYEILRKLRDAGMQPPSPFCVVEPIVFLPERNLLLQEKAAGQQLFEKIKEETATDRDAERAAEWLVGLQGLNVPNLVPGSCGDFERTRKELPDALPNSARRIIQILNFLSRRFTAAFPAAPSHGDYHPMNIYLDDERVTVIDVDTFAAREPMFDVGYFLAQSAVMGYHASGSFSPTENLRGVFLDTCERLAPNRFHRERIRVHVAFAFLRSLHYDFCILRSYPQEVVDPFLSAAERALSGARIRLAA
jgi:aminoglycoside phosphotransferase (APT) family kinase protein